MHKRILPSKNQEIYRLLEHSLSKSGLHHNTSERIRLSQFEAEVIIY